MTHSSHQMGDAGCDACGAFPDSRLATQPCPAFMSKPIRDRKVGRLITVGDTTLSVAGWARLRGWRDTTIFERLRRGWDPVAAVTEPKQSEPTAKPSVPRKASPARLLKQAGWTLLNVQRTALGWSIHVAAQ